MNQMKNRNGRAVTKMGESKTKAPFNVSVHILCMWERVEQRERERERERQRDTDEQEQKIIQRIVYWKSISVVLALLGGCCHLWIYTYNVVCSSTMARPTRMLFTLAYSLSFCCLVLLHSIPYYAHIDRTNVTRLKSLTSLYVVCATFLSRVLLLFFFLLLLFLLFLFHFSFIVVALFFVPLFIFVCASS